MKYKELEKKLKAAGCYPVGKQMSGHPLWYSYNGQDVQDEQPW